jgi:hypothetical protein
MKRKPYFVNLWLDNTITIRDIANMYCCGLSTIKQHAIKLGLPNRKIGRKKIIKGE